MKPETKNDLRCERIRLLLSRELDGEATATQRDELAAHVPECAACRAAHAVDVAVRERVATTADVPVGFADRVGAAVARQRSDAAAQNRFLLGAAAAAVLVAGVALVGFDGGVERSPRGDGVSVAGGTPRALAGDALRAEFALERAPRSGAEAR